jgi:hypothetical protein
MLVDIFTQVIIIIFVVVFMCLAGKKAYKDGDYMFCIAFFLLAVVGIVLLFKTFMALIYGG